MPTPAFRFGAREPILKGMGRGGKRTERMRTVVDCLPYETKLAMLEGLDRYEIIAGAYSDRRGGVCPMLAAHRCGGRTDFRAFARAWDRFTGAGRARRVNGRELRTLQAQLEQSVWNEERTRAELTRLPQERPLEPPAEPSPVFHAASRCWAPGCSRSGTSRPTRRRSSRHSVRSRSFRAAAAPIRTPAAPPRPRGSVASRFPVDRGPGRVSTSLRCTLGPPPGRR